jgi:hypothetical protein
MRRYRDASTEPGRIAQAVTRESSAALTAVLAPGLGIDRGDLVGGIRRLAGGVAADQQVNLGGLESDHLEGEAEVELREVLQLEREQVAIPVRVLDSPAYATSRTGLIPKAP